MTHYSSYLTDRQVELLLSTIEESAYLSKRDGFLVVLARCTKCQRSFEEEVGAYREAVIAREAVLCLACDPSALEPGFVGLTIQIGWGAG